MSFGFQCCVYGRDKQKGRIFLDDDRIVQLYWDRDEYAITATAEKYQAYCAAIAQNILGNTQDAEECVNDTYLHAWNAMPPHRPARLPVFLGKITRNLSINRYKQNRAGKRGNGEIAAVLDELAQVVSGKEDVEQEVDSQELAQAIDAFLVQLSPRKRNIFILRYWYTESISAIAARYGMKKGAVSMTLNRLRHKLQKELLERGFSL